MFFPGNPLNYPTNSLSSIRRYEATRAPNTFDIKNFNLGDEWLDTSSEDWYKLVSKDGGEALWCALCGTGLQAETFLPDSGTTPVVPDGANQVTFTGGPVETRTIETVGSLNTMTWNLVENLPGDRCFTCPSPNEAEFCWDCTLRCTSLRGFSTGFTGSEWITCQAGIQTVDGSTVPIATISPVDNSITSVIGTLAAARADHSAAITQTIIYGARRAGGGAIEISSSEGNFLSDAPLTIMMDADVAEEIVEEVY